MESITLDGVQVPVDSCIRVMECKRWALLKTLIEEPNGKYAIHGRYWQDHDITKTWPKCVLLRSWEPDMLDPRIYELSKKAFGQYTSPSEHDEVWDRELEWGLVRPASEMVNAIHEALDPTDLMVPYSIQLLYYKQGEYRGFEKGPHFDPSAYRYIVVANLRGQATIRLHYGKGKVVWSAPVAEGEMYLLHGPGIDQLQHEVKCFGSADRVVAVLRFVPLSLLRPIMSKVGEVSSPPGSRALRRTTEVKRVKLTL